MLRYRHLWPLVRQLPPEFAHTLGLNILRLPFRVAAPPSDPFTWNGLTFRNRVGIAAGFDKNAVCVSGVERLGAGFVEIGTVLVAPWQGNRVSPRMSRLLPIRGIWNRLGFTSRGVSDVVCHLERLPREKRRGLLVAANIGPHPGVLKKLTERSEILATARAEFVQLADALQPHCDFFVVNLSSPNTPGLRSLLQSPELCDTVVRPLRARLRECGKPLLVKLPPEDEHREPWTESTLNAVVGPLISNDACDGFVAVNTSTRLALKHVQGIANPELPGGVSGEPLREEALRVVRMLRAMIGPQRLLIGCGGVVEPAHAREFREAGADLVEIYSGMIYAGPGLIALAASVCAAMHRDDPSHPKSGKLRAASD